MSEITEPKSINIKTVYGKVSKKDVGKTLFNVAGYVDEIFSTQTNYGESFGIKGDLIAVNAETGEVFSSEAAFLPDSITKSIEKKLTENNEVEFKVSIKLIESSKNAQGYAYICEAPMTKERLARKAMLLERVSDLKAIAAT